ncbi:MAG: FG-GAP repeat domain-containing protein [Pirellulaceae bacterium]
MSILATWALFEGQDLRGFLPADEPSRGAQVDAGTELRIRRFCGDCHALPRPDSLPRDAWHEGVSRGYEFYARSGRRDLDPPTFIQTLTYYRARAPRHLEFPPPPAVAPVPPVPFRVEQLSFVPRADSVAPGIAFARWSRTSPDTPPALLACDMRRGTLWSVNLGSPERTATSLAQLHNPCHVASCDLDADGQLDLIVADLGSYFPFDHSLGRVVWLHRRPGHPGYETTTVAADLGRIADVQPADVDGDGNLDLIVAEFGHDRTGGIHLLRQRRAADGAIAFERRRLDPRPGPIHIPVLDINRDGRPDFLALVSQEREQIDLFVNRGGGQFTRQLIWAAPDLTFASSGIDVVDLDRDGDSDIVLTNGDAFDNSYVSPTHGVRWLEQQDNSRFVCHSITDLPGAYCARPGDVDGDGDLDLVVGVWLPPQIRPENVARDKLASLVYLEKAASGQFIRHALETGDPSHTTVELADFDGDGDLDCAVGRHVLSGRVRHVPGVAHSATIWWNQTAPAASAR